jgi:hypothetical protein
MKSIYLLLSILCLTVISIAKADTVVVQPTPNPSATGVAPTNTFGPGSSGGGPAIVFLDENNMVKSSESLDLYEGQIKYGLTITKSSTPAADQVAAIVQRLKSFNYFMASDLERALTYIQAHEIFLPDGVMMPPGVDIGDTPAFIPDGSQLDYVGWYQTDGTLEISSTVYNALTSETDRAAFLIHEGIYSMARRFSQASTSTDSRRFVAYLFSEADLTQLNDILPEFTWSTSIPHPMPDGTVFHGPGFDDDVLLSGDATTITVHVTGGSQNGQYWIGFSCVNEQEEALNQWSTAQVNYNDFESSFPFTLPDGEPCDAISVSIYGSDDYGKVTISYGDQIIGGTPDPRASNGIGISIPIYR